MTTPARLGRQAVVIGGSLSGLMAARVLADQFDQVTVIERDMLPDGPAERKGVPQGPHAHTLLIRGQQIMAELFPGLTADLAALGAVRVDSGADIVWHQHGVVKARWQTGLDALSLTRPLLEWQVRLHVQKTPNIRLLTGYRVLDLLTDATKQKVAGVRFEPVDRKGAVMLLEADLVVDAGGRGSRAPQWLEAMGYPSVPVTELKVNVVYASRLYKAPSVQPGFKMLLQMAEAPSTRIAVLFPVEGDRVLVTAQAMLGDEPPTDEAGFLAFLRTLPLPETYELAKSAEPLSPIIPGRAAASVRRHYERLTRFPDGFVVVGDSVAAFNPRYGQGMTAAALGVEALQRCLGQAGALEPGFSLRFQKELARAIDLPWQASTGEDLAYPATEGERPYIAPVVNWYMRRVVRLCAHDQEVHLAFLKVVHLLRPMTDLVRPSLLWKVLTLREGRLASAPPTTAPAVE